MLSRQIRTTVCVLLAALLCVFTLPLAHAQTNTTGLSGTVTDQTGALMPGVQVSILNPATGQMQTENTKSKGEYSFEQIPPGTYEMRVKFAGFSEQTQKVELLVATPVKVNFQLSVGNAEIVNVESSMTAVNSTDATLGKAFSSKQIENLPYLANNVTYLLSLQPGVLALDPGATTGGLNTDTRTGIVNGARQDQTNVTLDGVDNNDQTSGYAFNGALRATRESVEEFRVTTTNANADAGRSSGGQVSLLTRSGTNAIHGSAYEFYRGGVGAGNNWFLKQAQLTSKQPNKPVKILQHTYGASLGAPIKKDKLFFFGAYEGFKQASSTPVSRTVPSIIGGTGLVTGNVVYGACNPGVASCATPQTYKTLTPADIAQLDQRASDPACQTVPNPCIAPSSNAASLAYFKQFPLANSNTGGDGYNTGTYTFSSPVPLHQITNIAKFDWNLTPKQSLYVRGNLQSDNQQTALQFQGLPPASSIYGNNKGVAGGYIYAISNNLTNNLRYGFIRQGVGTRGTGSQPYVSFAAFDLITAATTSSIYQISTHNLNDDFTWNKGRHTIQVGLNERLVYNNRYFDSPLLSYASISKNILATAAISGKGITLDPGVSTCADCAQVATNFRTFYDNDILANTGIIQSAQSGTEYTIRGGSLVPAGNGIVPTHQYKSLEQEYYVQDQWKVTSQLTVTAGLRYAYYGTPFETSGQQIAPTVDKNAFLASRMAAAAAGTNYTTPLTFALSGSANNAPNFWNPQKGNFAPRISLAYSTRDGKTSVRGGFALAYDHVGQGIISQYDSGSGSLLSLAKTNKFTYADLNTGKRFTGYHDSYTGNVAVANIALPNTPTPGVTFNFLNTINNVIKTPYAETFNLSLQHELTHGLTLTTSYVGRLGRHLLANLDIAQPTNLYDSTSGQTYFQAATGFDKMIDAGVQPAAVTDTGYFHDLFPNYTYTYNKIAYKGAQAYYARMFGGRGNETDPLFDADTNKNVNTNCDPGVCKFFFPQVSSIFTQSTIGTSNYHALQVSLRHQLKYGLVYDVNYTFAKSMDLGSSPERSNGNAIHNTFNPSGDYGVSDFDVRHNITGNYNMPLPFGHGRPFLSNTNGLLDRIIGGWQINGVVHYSTGFPFSAVASGNYGTNFDVPSYFVQTGSIPTGGHNYVTTNGTPYETALKGITPTQAFANLRYAYAGETGQRNKFRADGYLSFDDGLSKEFRTWREQAFRLSVEVFNVGNNTRFNAITTNGASTKFGQYTGTTGSTQGLLSQPRQMQFSGMYRF